MLVRILFETPVLGTLSGNKKVFTDFQANKHPEGTQQEELDAIPLSEQIEKGSTIFPRDEKGYFIWDYQWKGFFKETIEALYHLSGNFTKEYQKKFGIHPYRYKKTVDKLIMVYPRKCYFTMPEGGELSIYERPLRGQTMQGERICLTRSEMLPAGTVSELEIRWNNDALGEIIEHCLDSGKELGTLQFRSGGYGRFIWKQVDSFADTRIAKQELECKPAAIW